jgi:hypothetical protein
MNFIAREFPAMLPRFERLYARKYPPEGYRNGIRALVRRVLARYRLGEREGRGAEAAGPLPPHAEQVGFVW